jgi:signal transduction histidine kinase
MKNQPIKVLLIEDNPSDARMIQIMLSGLEATWLTPLDFSVVHVDRLAAGLDCLTGGEFDVVLLDLMLPDSKELNTLAEMQTRGPDVPIVVLTGAGDERTGFRAVRAGAQGYLMKGEVRRTLLVRTILHAIERHRLWAELQASRKALREYLGQLEERVQERTTEIHAQYARLEAVLDSTSDGIIVTDREGEILQANPVAEGWLRQTLSPEDAERLEEAVREVACRADERPERVLELTGLDLGLKAAPITGAGLGEAAVVVAIHDVSHLKVLDRMKTRFVSNVSHELRTPITTIKLYASLMERSPEKWGQYLVPLVQEAERQVRLVEDILQISHIDTGRMEVKPRPTPLNELVSEILTTHKGVASEYGLTLELQLNEPGPVAQVDPNRMMQVLNNLVVNAIHYTPQGRQVVISTGREEADGRMWATVKVSDTGMGIPEEEIPHIFDRFFRGKEPRDMQLPGTGLGLAIVKEIVDLHGGRVTVESQVGEGSTFAVWLPLARQDPD